MLSMILDLFATLVEAVVGASQGPRSPRWARVLWVGCCVLLALAAVAAVAYPMFA
ncbi:MAG: hypothetical protein LW636_01070 [Planctomycetaceae bacterium]|jgi:hypothetical protein|nr:hypothetical protein [Planctomycetaceae bacterium]